VRESLYPIRDRVKAVFEEASLHVIRNGLRTVMLRPFVYDSPVSEQHPRNCDGLYVQSDHPGARRILSLRERFQRGAHPLMKDYDCRAAFNTATILANGDVQLCYKFSVGNLARNTFEEIWFGEEADRVRRRITGAPADCSACDCFRFGIAFHRLEADRLENYFNMEFALSLGDIDFDAGTFRVQPPPKPPRLAGSEAGYNIVAYKDRYIGIPQSAGSLEIDKADLSAIPGVVIEESYARALAAVRAITRNAPMAGA